ncbi:MAG: class I mannose-6-phosphate isomerase [Ruminococcaceae bacterium]|nr:class I mannose-6-phosphate isomerase [Oscillospiraceae bacterium]
MEILKLNPVFKDYIWGGTRLRDDFGFDTGFDKTAEGWMLSCHKAGMNTVCGGKYDGRTLEEIIDEVGTKKLCGENSAKFPYFPVLIKLIDARDNLSVQVHPDDAYARRVENEFGKTEMWYVLDATDGAELIYGFKEKITKDEFRKSIENGTLLDRLNSVKVKKGDLFFIEAGTVHAIGKGVLIAEIQQNSNCTYRVYDYGRLGADGKPRELHIDKAVDVSVTEPPKHDAKPMGKLRTFDGYTEQLLTECELFTVTKYEVTKSLTLSTDSKSFNHILVTNGYGKIGDMPFKKGDSLFVPAAFGDYRIEGKAEIIITCI